MRKFTIVAAAAIIAVLVGAGGATAGSLVTSAKIKNGTIQTVDLSSSAKRALKGAQGPQGVPGKAGVNGVNGTSGVQGPAGGFDPAKVRYVEGTPVTVRPGETGVAAAYCPSGSKVVGGGHLFGYADGGINVEISAPLSDGSGWGAGFGNGGTVEGEVTAYAVCAAK